MAEDILGTVVSNPRVIITIDTMLPGTHSVQDCIDFYCDLYAPVMITVHYGEGKKLTVDIAKISSLRFGQ